jgi:hypothetical protein
MSQTCQNRKSRASFDHLVGTKQQRTRDFYSKNVGMGIRDKPTAPASPWQNGIAERLAGSIQNECVDHIIVLGELHLRQILQSYARYYDRASEHPFVYVVEPTKYFAACEHHMTR